jgi:hypothetical protein
MTSDFAFEIVDLALSLARLLASGKVQQDATFAGILVQIIGKARQAYQEHTGKALDPSLIEAEQPF